MSILSNKLILPSGSVTLTYPNLHIKQLDTNLGDLELRFYDSSNNPSPNRIFIDSQFIVCNYNIINTTSENIVVLKKPSSSSTGNYDIYIKELNPNGAGIIYLSNEKTTTGYTRNILTSSTLIETLGYIQLDVQEYLSTYTYGLLNYSAMTFVSTPLVRTGLDKINLVYSPITLDYTSIRVGSGLWRFNIHWTSNTSGTCYIQLYKDETNTPEPIKFTSTSCNNSSTNTATNGIDYYINVPPYTTNTYSIRISSGTSRIPVNISSTVNVKQISKFPQYIDLSNIYFLYDTANYNCNIATTDTTSTILSYTLTKAENNVLNSQSYLLDSGDSFDAGYNYYGLNLSDTDYYAFDFQQNMYDYLVMSNSLFNSDFTFCTWIKVKKVSGYYNGCIIGSLGTSFGFKQVSTFSYLEFTDNGTLVVQYDVSSLSDDSWVFFALSYEDVGGNIKMYINGSVVATDSQVLNYDTSLVYIGKEYGLNNFGFGKLFGKMSFMSFYSSQLSDSKVGDIYNITKVRYL